jgi:plastocyanin
MRFALVLAAVALATGAAGCGSDSNGGSSSSGSSSAKSGGPSELELDDNYFKPTTISGKAGSTVKLELANDGSAEHTFTIDSQKVDKELKGGEKAEVTVKFPASGSVQFYCRYHKASGMVGKLTVGSGAAAPTKSGSKSSSY